MTFLVATHIMTFLVATHIMSFLVATHIMTLVVATHNLILVAAGVEEDLQFAAVILSCRQLITWCIIKSFRSRRSFIWSPLWTP